MYVFTALVPPVLKTADQGHSVHLHAQFSRAVVKARLGHLTGLLSLSQYTCTEAEPIYCPTLLR